MTKELTAMIAEVRDALNLYGPLSAVKKTKAALTTLDKIAAAVEGMGEPDEYYCDILPEDQHLADQDGELAEAFESLNKLIRERKKPISWGAGKCRTSVNPTRESDNA